MARHRLHIVDGDSRRRAQLARIAHELGHHAEVYSNLEELAARPLHEGILVVHDLPDRDDAGEAAETLALLEDAGVWLPVILADERPTTDQVVEGIKQGALDFIELPCREERLVTALNRVAQEAATQATMHRRMLAARERIAMLSRREREVLDCLAEGHSNKEIARALGISARTVEIHRANMMAKLDANHVAEAVRMQIEARLAADVLAA
jgi:FixJ family two-component response regulator